MGLGRRVWESRPWRVALAVLAGLGLLLLAALPFLIWTRQPSRELRVLILDKTVPDLTRREHAGLSWLLRHRKIRRPGGADYDAAIDYYGFFPLPDHQWEIREPSIAAASPELIYLADTYGVYTEEFYGKPTGNRTAMIYGGLRPDEIGDLRAALPGCLTLVGEFNSFADPTSGEARQACMDWFGLSWNGWIGRYFRDLDRQLEVPPWAVRNYERQTGREWLFDGPGFLFVNEDDQVEVLEEGVDVARGRGLRFKGLPEGRARLDLPEDARYDYWFDLVQPKAGTEVLAEYELPLLPPGEKKLKALGLGARTPAVLASRLGPTRCFYFAGDFVDAWPVPNMHRLAGLAPFRRVFSREVPGDPSSFYWRVYVPLMSRVLEDTLARRRDPRRP
jgi:hypothetical protein